MTPTEQDNELREAILLEFKNVHRLAPADYTENCTNIVMKLITADRKRVALEARIDELENRLRVQFIPSHWERLCTEVNSWAKYVDRRIAELEAQQEKLRDSNL